MNTERREETRKEREDGIAINRKGRIRISRRGNFSTFPRRMNDSTGETRERDREYASA